MENKHEYCSHFFISIFSLKPGNPNVVDTFSNDVCILKECLKSDSYEILDNFFIGILQFDA